MRKIRFEVVASDGMARAGILEARGVRILTPVFMPVGTAGAVKTLTPAEVWEVGGRILLANTYHLILRPGVEVIERAGGIAAFMKWEGPVLTDSGGFQVFSLAKACRIEEEGVVFRSHLDGSSVFLSPESVIEAQRRMRSTIAMPLDVCPPAEAGEREMERAMDLTTRWLDRTIKVLSADSPALFGIFQGGTNLSFRLRHIQEISSRSIEGIAIGGLSVGEEKAKTRETVEACLPAMPAGMPRYLMGVGTPDDLLHAISCGVDMFDCVFPTQVARHGLVLSSEGRYSIKGSRWKEDPSPLDPACCCAVCAKFDKRYLRHIFLSGETLAGRLISYHNLAFYFSLLEGAREAIVCYKFNQFRKDALERMRILDEED